MFAYIWTGDDTTYSFHFTITRVATGSVVYDLEGEVEPGRENGVEVHDEWLNEQGTYRARCEVGRGAETVREVEINHSPPNMWACSRWLMIEVEDGTVESAVLHGDGNRC